MMFRSLVMILSLSIVLPVAAQQVDPTEPVTDAGAVGQEQEVATTAPPPQTARLSDATAPKDEQSTEETTTTILRRAQTQGAQDQVFYAPAGVERMRIDSDTGAVGIGTNGVASPYELLVKSADDAATVQAENLGPAAAAAFRSYSDTATVNLTAFGSGYTTDTHFGTVLAGWSEILAWRGNGLMIGTLNGTPLTLGTSNTNRLHITADGDIGIGTASPGANVSPTIQESPLHILSTENKQTILQVQNTTNDVNAAAMTKTLADTAALNMVSHASNRTISRFGVTLGGWNELFSYTGNGLAIGTWASAPLILGTNSENRLQITGSGDIGIGTPSPSAKLHVEGTIFGRATNSGYTADGVWNALARPSKIIMPNGQELRFGYSDAGSGQYYPSIGFATRSTAINDSMLILQARVAQVVPESFNRFQVSGGGTIGWGPGVTAVDATLYRSAPGTLRTNASVTIDGNVGIGTTTPTQRLHVEGNIHVSGNINAKYQDMAEWVPSNSDLAPGTVVVLDASVGNGVMASSRPYDTTVAGVVSAQPGIVLGEAGAEKEQIATTGRVRVKVDASRGAIAVGDLLVTSDKPGYAMRSTPIEVAGTFIHRPGTIVGKALEPLLNGEGEILVLLSLQ